MEAVDYEKILDGMYDTGVCVIRERDRAVLYANRWAQAAARKMRLGVPCHELWGGLCGICPLQIIGDRDTNHAIGSFGTYGGPVDIRVARTTWQDGEPAFTVTITPRTEDLYRAIVRSRYRTIGTVDLESGSCRWTDLSDGDGVWRSTEEDYPQYLLRRLSETVRPEDSERYYALFSLEHLRQRAKSTEDGEESLRYQARDGRWLEQRAIFARQGQDVVVHLLSQDVSGDNSQETEDHQALLDRSYIISSLRNLFFSIYYMDLDSGTYRAVTQLDRVQDLLGSEVDGDAALQIYANSFIHPDDRARYLSVMNVENFRRTLRWWNPSISVVYRKASNGSEDGSWVRATAVLAQTGPDDLPKTMVYAAQDIGEVRLMAPEKEGDTAHG